ncbi:hypothetical protein AB2G41_24870 (plasmid) [Escherichia coli]
MAVCQEQVRYSVTLSLFLAVFYCAHFGFPAAWRHPVVRPDYDRQLLAHPPVSAEPAGAVSGCRYGPMREKPGLQRPFRSRRLCRAVTCAPCTPDGV